MGKYFQMKSFKCSNRMAGAGVALVMLLGLFAGALYFHSSSAGAHAANPGTIRPHAVNVSPKYLSAGAQLGTGDVKFGCQAPGAPVRCYGPNQIRNAYAIQPLLDKGLNGQGRTIVIIDAFQSPTIVHDLHLFDSVFGLHNPTLNIIAPYGLTPFNPNDPNQVGWSAEITLDVEWSHAVAPDATIDLVLALSNQDQDLFNVTKYAIDHNLGDVLSQSFGEAETCADPNLLAQEHALYEEAKQKGITVFASSGDQGAAQLTCDGSTYFLSASTPASDPLVTSVGATYLNANPQTGKYQGEAAWNDSFGASGGGFSTIYARPGYQGGFFSNKGRGVPDVAYNGDVNGGVLGAWSESGQGKNLFFIFGGTSAGSPQWAALTAIADQAAHGRLGFINPKLYSIARNPSLYAACFHDITVGDNTFTGAGSNGQQVTIQGYNTHTGWDAVTGLGTPIANVLVKVLSGGGQ
jgi:subtilase family serine protease